MKKIILEGRALVKSYLSSEPVLSGANLELYEGGAAVLLGSSGSGKSTLLHMLGLLDRPDQGEVLFLGRSTKALNSGDLAKIRLKSMGFIFQFHHLISELTVLENVVLPAEMLGQNSQEESRESAESLLRRVGLEKKLDRFPWQLSGGEQQRVAVARSLINRPQVLLTDEATGNLDPERAKDVVDLILELSRISGATLLSVTHDQTQAARYPKQYRLKDGRIVE